MRDADKTKSQLIEELMKMRVRVAELEGSDSDKNSEKLKDKAMPESAERLRMVLEATSDGIWDWDIKTGQAYFSPRYYTMLGYEPDEFPSNYDNWRRLIHPDDVKATEAVIQRALEEHNSFSVEFRMKNKNGDWIWILSRGRAFEMDNEGKLVRMAGSHTDISGSKQVEESLRLTQFILDNAPIGIWRIGTDSQILDVNQQGADSLGYSRDELRGMAIFDFDPEYSPEDWADGISMMKQTGPNTIETRHQSKNGHIFPVQVIKKLIQFGEKEYNIAFVQDITERRRNEESLRLTRFIFEKAPIGIWRIGTDGKVLDVNEEGADRLGYSRDELRHMTVFDFVQRFSTESWDKGISELNRLGFKIFEVQHLCRNGETFPVEVTSKLIQFGEKKYAIAFVQDITERRRNEEALREKDRLLHDMGRLARIGAWKYAVDTRKITSTNEMNRIYDFGPGQDTGVEGHLGCYHGENRDKITRAFNEALEHGTPYDLELELLSARGVNKWVRVIGYPVMKDGRVTELQGSLQDITEIKRAETRLKLSESRYRALIELSPLGVGMVNSDGILVDTNQALASMLGYEKEDLLGLNFKDITHPDDIALEISLLQALAKDEKSSYSLEKRYRHRSGDFFWINISVAKTSDIYGPGVFYFGFIENISNRKQMEKEREELIDDLKKALAEIRELRGFIPICASCKKIRDDEGYWQQVEKYISDRTDAKFSHGICPECAKKLYPDYYEK